MKLKEESENLLIFIRRFNYYNLNLLKSELYIFRFILKSHKKNPPLSRKAFHVPITMNPTTNGYNENPDTGNQYAVLGLERADSGSVQGLSFSQCHPLLIV